MWAGLSVLGVLVVCSLALDSNIIRSSKELLDPSSSSLEARTGSTGSTRSSIGSRSSWDQRAAGCEGRDCNTPLGGGCRTRVQTRTSVTLMEPQRHSDRLNRTKGVEMASCVRSADCSAGLCCVRYLTGKRCQRVPRQGEVCLLRGPTKLRRNLGRCDCASHLVCHAAAAAPGGKAQGTCVPRPRQGQRKTRHSGKKRRPVASEISC